MFTMILIAVLLMPIVLGWVFMIAWPLAAIAGVLITTAQSLFSIARQKTKENEVLKQAFIFKLLNEQKLIPWSKIYSSMEVSCLSSVVQKWMIGLGIIESSSSHNKSYKRNAISFPGSFDLVTDLLDCNPKTSLDQHYRRASDHVRLGGLFVDLEQTPLSTSLLAHINSAHKFGFKLIERSDRQNYTNHGASHKPWQSQVNTDPTVMLVWCKV
jgi:hypothetical protein